MSYSHQHCLIFPIRKGSLCMRIQGLYLFSANLEKFCFFLLSMSHQDLFALYDISVQIDNVKLKTVHLCNLCTVYLQMVFEPCKGGKSWMLEHNEISLLQRSALSEQSKSPPVSTGSTTDIGLLRSLEPASKRDILGIVLRNLKVGSWVCCLVTERFYLQGIVWFVVRIATFSYFSFC